MGGMKVPVAFVETFEGGSRLGSSTPVNSWHAYTRSSQHKVEMQEIEYTYMEYSSIVLARIRRAEE